MLKSYQIEGRVLKWVKRFTIYNIEFINRTNEEMRTVDLLLHFKSQPFDSATVLTEIMTFYLKNSSKTNEIEDVVVVLQSFRIFIEILNKFVLFI